MGGEGWGVPTWRQPPPGFGLPVGRASAPTAGSKSEHTNGLVMPIHCRKALQRQGQADQPLDSRGIGTSKCGQSSLELCCKGE